MPEAAPAVAAAPAAKPAAPVVDAKPGEAKAETPPPPKMHKVKVDGKEVDVAEEELHKHYGTFAAGQKALKEAAEEKKKAAGVISALKAGDYSALTDAGLSEEDIEGLSIKFLSSKQQAKLEEERLKALDPKERELEQLRKEKKDREDNDKKGKEEEHKREVEAAEKTVTKSVIDTLEEFPETYRRNDFIAQRVFDAWAYYYENRAEIDKSGIKVDSKFIAGRVRAELRGLSRQMAESAGDDEIDEFVPDSLAGRVLQRRQTKAQTKAHPALTQEPQVRGKGDEERPEKTAPTTAKLMRRSYFGGA